MSREAGTNRPSVIIVGGGIAGLAAGCYAQMSGMRSTVLEKHVLPGGCCTAWGRDGYIFDYCIEWLLGTAAGNEANQVWRELGALDGKEITNFEMFNRVVGADGRSVTFYNDPDRLERHLLEVSPADAPLLRSFCQDLRRFLEADLLSFLTPPSLRTAREEREAEIKAAPVRSVLERTSATRLEDFTARLRDPLLRRAFPNIFFQDHESFPLLPYLLNMAEANHGNAGVPQGGSLGLARSVEQRHRSLGGEVNYRSRVARIFVENDRAVGVELRGGRRHYADHVISACDGRTTLYGLLDGRYTSPAVDRLYGKVLPQPGAIYPGVVSVFVGVDGDLPPEAAHSTTYLLSEQDSAELPGTMQRSLVVQLRSRYWSGCAPPGKSLFHCTYFTDYDSWKRLRRNDRRAYRARKRQAAAFVCGFLERHHPGIGARIETVDVASPVTNHRYTGNLEGSILGWKSFGEADELLDEMIDEDRMRLPGLRGFSMAGQWIGGGGLIRAASTGRFAVRFLCEELGVPFQAWPSDDQRPWRPDMLGELPLLDRNPSWKGTTSAS